jgi:hypothetical protein
MIECKTFNASGIGYLSDTILAIDYCRLAGANVMSNSYAFNVASELQYEAILRANAAGIVFVAGAGNSSGNSDLTPFYPAGFSIIAPNVLAVGATTRNDTRASFSNYGLKSVDIFAPGVDILSTYFNNSYVVGSGTSMATPHVAGSAALLRAQYPSETAAEIRGRLRANADRVPALAGLCASGRLNVFRALVANRVTLSGHVTLQDWTLGPESQTLSVILRQGGAEMDRINNVPINADGTFSLTTTRSGPHDTVVKAPHWLAKSAPVNIGAGGASGMNFVLANGDCDGDNEVAIGDYALLSAAYNTVPGDLHWNARADLDGDDSVDVGDFAILSTNYGMTGD